LLSRRLLFRRQRCLRDGPAASRAWTDGRVPGPDQCRTAQLQLLPHPLDASVRAEISAQSLLLAGLHPELDSGTAAWVLPLEGTVGEEEAGQPVLLESHLDFGRGGRKPGGSFDLSRRAAQAV